MSWKDKITLRRAKAIEQQDPPDAGPVKNNPLDKIITERGNTPTATEIYKARWVWYHTILAVEIAFTNILLLALIVIEIIK